MICPVCHKEFSLYRVNQKYCSEACRRLAWNMARRVAKLQPVRCAWCFEWFTPSRVGHRCCSKKCADYHYQSRHKRKYRKYLKRYYAKHKLQIKIRRIRKELAQ